MRAVFCAIGVACLMMVDVMAQVPLTWDANGSTVGQTDGGGTWLNPNQWWNGSTNQDWVAGSDAVIGNGGTVNATITLGAVTASNVTFGSFTGTYTLNSGSLTNSGGVTTTTNSGNVTIYPPIGGAGGLTVNNPAGKILLLKNDGNSYSGPTIVTSGILQAGTAWNGGAQSIPGGINNPNATSGSNLELNGGTFTISYYFRRSLGAGPGQFQITGGTSGFSHWQSDTYGQIVISNDANQEIVWGSTHWRPDVLVLNEEAAAPTQVVNIKNKIDLNGTNRTVACNSTKSIGPARVDASNGWIDTAGGRLTGVIRNTGGTPAGLIKSGPGVLQLTANNTYDGDTTVSEGELQLRGSSTLADGAALRVAAGATVDLGSGINETVNLLFLDHRPTAVGTWGSSASTVDNVDDTYFSGEGVLTVLDSQLVTGTRIIVH